MTQALLYHRACYAARVAHAFALLLLCFVFANFGAAFAAGLVGQPKPPAAVIATIRRASDDIVGTGDLGRARGDLLLAVENHPTADLTEHLALVVRDNTSYDGLAATYEDAAKAKTGDEQRYVLYNLARLHLLRARQMLRGGVRSGSGALQSVLAVAARTARRVADPAITRDVGALELLGDVFAEQNDTQRAQAAYERIALSGVPNAPAMAGVRVGALFLRAGRTADAEAALRRGISSAAGAGADLTHQLYQNLALAYVRRSAFGPAADALERSARVTLDPSATPFRLRTDVAQTLLDRGYAREVNAYATAALRVTPDDEALRNLQRAAAARTRLPSSGGR